MRYYDAQIIVRYIGRNKARLDRIDIGIMEDWLETNQRIYADDKLLIDLPRGDKPLIIRSIQGSMWGTPVMRVVFKDGKVIVLNAFKSVGNNMSPDKVQKTLDEYKKNGVKMLGWDGVLR